MSFRDELKKSIRSPEDVNREKIAKENQACMAEASLTFNDIKKSLIDSANNAKYNTHDGATTVSCICRISQRFFSRRTVNNSEELRQNQQKFFLFRDPGIVYCTWDCFEVKPMYSHEYNQYVAALKELAAHENISVEMVIHDTSDNRVYPFPSKLKRFYSVSCYLAVRATITI